MPIKFFGRRGGRDIIDPVEAAPADEGRGIRVPRTFTGNYAGAISEAQLISLRVAKEKLNEVIWDSTEAPDLIRTMDRWLESIIATQRRNLRQAEQRRAAAAVVADLDRAAVEEAVAMPQAINPAWVLEAIRVADVGPQPPVAGPRRR